MTGVTESERRCTSERKNNEIKRKKTGEEGRRRIETTTRFGFDRFVGLLEDPGNGGGGGGVAMWSSRWFSGLICRPEQDVLYTKQWNR